MRPGPSKKAQITMQFNWVFAIVIGAVILTFFVIVIQKQKKSSDLDLANELLSDMDLILAGQSVSVGREDLMEIPKRELSFDCEEYSIMDMSRQKGNAIIFAPNTFESDRMLAWTLSWDLPFKIANFIYLTTPDIKYYLVYQTEADITDPLSAGEYIMKNFPENLELRDVEVTNTGIIPKDDNQIRLIYLGGSGTPGMPEKLTGSPDKDVTALRIDVGANDLKGLERGSVTFYIKRGNQFFPHNEANGGLFAAGKYPSFGKEAVFGAMFTNDINQYHCTMLKALKRMSIVANVYNKRANRLMLQASPSCVDHYKQVFDNFIYNKQNLAAVDSADYGDLDAFRGKVFGGFEIAFTTNRNAILGSCSTLY